jgi:peptide/nickel transport system substrate-binding protein
MRVVRPEDLERLLHEYRRGRLSRRHFVQALGTGGIVLAGSALAAACGPTPPPAAPEEKAAKPAAAPTQAPAKPAEAAKPAAAPTTAPAPAAKAAAPAAGRDNVVMVFATDVTSMDPHQNVLREGIKLFYHLYDNLGVRDYEANRIKPHLATSWKAASDTRWEMEIRNDVKFHNGDPFTAETIKFNIERVLDPETKSPQRGNWLAIERIEVVDPTHLVWHTKNPYPVFVERLQNLQFISEKVFKERGAQYVAENAIGTGPYKFVRWDRGQEIVMERNDEYWGPKPAFKNASVRVIKDIATAVAELLAGRVDIVPAFPIDQMKTLESSGAGKAAVTPILRTLFRHFDANARTGPSPVQDKNVRMAINHACNVDGYIKSLQAGGDRTPGNVSKLAFGFDPTVQPYAYDPNKAKELLAQSGWKPGSDGIMEKDGQKLELRFLNSPSTVPNVKLVNEAIAQDLQQVGIKVNIETYSDSTAYTSMAAEGKAGPMHNWDWGYYSVYDADGILWDMHHSSSPYAYYSNPELDKLLEEGRQALDLNARKTAYQKASAIIAQDLPYYVLSYQGYQLFYSKALGNLEVNPRGYLRNVLSVDKK